MKQKNKYASRKEQCPEMYLAYKNMICDKCGILIQLLKRVIYLISGVGKNGYLWGRIRAQTPTSLMEKK